jgi:hypothetical protein
MDAKNTQAEGAELAPVEDVKEDVKIETEGLKSHHMDVGPGVLSIDLPCGFIDEGGNLHDTLTVGEMTGYEEDILAGKGPIVPRLNQIIANCTKSFGAMDDKREIGRAVTQMTASDRLAALIAIRRVSLGDFYDVKIECPSCREQSRFSLNLAQIDILRMKDQMQRKREDALSSGRKIRWHIMSAVDEEWLSKRTKKKEDVLTLAMLARVDAVEIDKDGDGKFAFFEIDRDGKGFKQALAVLKSLSIRERNDIRKLFDEHEGSVDTEVEFECPACQYEWKSDMDVGQAGFFFPSDT